MPDPNVSSDAVISDQILAKGEQFFALMEKTAVPSIFSKKGFYGLVMDWSMKDANFKTQMFRFVDVLPTLTSSAEINKHLKEYLDNDEVNLPTPLRLALKAASLTGGLFGGGVKSQVSGMARQFMLGSDPKEILATLKKLNDQDVAFTVDLLGEAVVSEAEADHYQQLYLDLMDSLARETAKWKTPCKSDQSPRGEVPRVNISVKISALYSAIRPDDPDTAIAKLSERLRPLLRRAAEIGAHINFDMEHYALKNLTLRLFKEIFSEPEFAIAPQCGLAMQAYLKEGEQDLRDIIAWARERQKRITVRLVKGAYWDFEVIVAQQKNWSIPVWEQKHETDICFEKCSRLLLDNDDAVTGAFATHNVRSIANILAYAEAKGVDKRNFEFQMLYGMADAMKSVVLALGCRLREYCPVGELLPGMAYLVRRLLENTSNEGFLANKFAKGAGRDELLADPAQKKPAPISPKAITQITPLEFKNSAPIDFTVSEEQQKFRNALQKVRGTLGRKYPLVIANREVATNEWMPSLNPANPSEVIGHQAKATIDDAERALEAAVKAQPAWAKIAVSERAALLDRVADLMHAEKSELSALEVLESGKAWAESDADVDEAIDFCRFYAAEMRALGGLKTTQHLAGETNKQHWLPRGVGVVISPWNFPLAILCGMVTAAIVTGNTVVMKPAEQSPVIAARFMELLMKAGLPAGVVNLLSGLGEEVGAHLVAHPKTDFIAFTGSEEVGLHIWKTAAKTFSGQRNLKKVVCEMGGKNALIIDGDADLDEAVLGAVHSAFGFQGQKCSALSRLIVLADNYDKFVERFVAATAALRIGAPEFAGNAFGPVIDETSYKRTLKMIEFAISENKLAFQGELPTETNGGYFVPPTIFTDVKPESQIFREEIFGPVVAITKAKNFDEAIALANDSDFALTGGCYSRSPVNLQRVQEELHCGNLYLNRSITGAIVGRQPFGGFAMSGGGTKAGGSDYLQNFMVPRVITENCMRRGFAPEE